MSEQLESHYFAGRLVDAIRREAFEQISDRLRANAPVQEIEIAEFILGRFAEQGLVTDSTPIVGVNANASNPHYAPTREASSPIRPGDLVLIDMWAKLDRPGAVYYDITWTGFCGPQPPSEMQNVFEVVRDARDCAVDVVRSAIAEKRPLCGWEVDDAARGHIRQKGFGDYFPHRTGHSIGEEVHGNGANLDNLETHDERPIIPRTCFSVEPGIYLEKFGIRSEINCYVSEKDAGPTGEVQQQLVTI
jgi:Xaa-Pro aminopeptidase